MHEKQIERESKLSLVINFLLLIFEDTDWSGVTLLKVIQWLVGNNLDGMSDVWWFQYSLHPQWFNDLLTSPYITHFIHSDSVVKIILIQIMLSIISLRPVQIIQFTQFIRSDSIAHSNHYLSFYSQWFDGQLELL